MKWTATIAATHQAIQRLCCLRHSTRQPAPATAAASAHDDHGEHYVEPLEPNVGWSDWAAERSYGLAGAIAGFQNGHLSKYILISVLGVAAILLLTLAGSTLGVSQTITGPR